MQQTNEALQQLKNVHVVTDADQVRRREEVRTFSSLPFL